MALPRHRFAAVRALLTDTFQLSAGVTLPEAVRALAFIVLAPVLGPQPYGILGLAALVVALPRILVRDAWVTPLVSLGAADESCESSGFWLVAVLGLLLIPPAILVAHWIGGAVGEPALPLAVAVLLSAEYLSGLAGVSRARLLRRRRLVAIGGARLFGISCGAAIGILLALQGSGFWSLVWLGAVSGLLEAVLLAALAGWRPRLELRSSHARRLLAMTLRIAATLSLVFLEQLLARGLVAMQFGTRSLGQFMLGRRLLDLAIGVSGLALGRAALIRFVDRSGAGGQEEALRLSLLLAGLIGMIVGAAMAWLAPPLLASFAGAAWSEALRLLAAFAVVAAAAPAQMVVSQWLRARGMAGIELRLRVLGLLLLALLIALLLPLGVVGMAWAMAVRGWIMLGCGLWVVRAAALGSEPLPAR